ncbi:YbhB/YbcL family Raf kinase inhibitor-like protein [Peredibacter sp. HCB2-198]|uniref:YbhB/YbcL family Raf kinase inhibitor-like protein n=1 Tax=Peredibacter sp. HCB2-198 TaxID=3383025 RepID=UPI0038B69DFF
MDFTLTSSSLTPGQSVPNHFIFDGLGCHGDNVSPALEWSGAPDETKSFAVTVFDPDAPTDHGWWHWAVVNIPVTVTSLEEGASNNRTLPKEAIEVMTDFNKTGYGGPCPPRGDKPHRYIFTVHALRKELDVKPNTNGVSIEKKIEANSLARASFTVQYGR